MATPYIGISVGISYSSGRLSRKYGRRPLVGHESRLLEEDEEERRRSVDGGPFISESPWNSSISSSDHLLKHVSIELLLPGYFSLETNADIKL